MAALALFFSSRPLAFVLSTARSSFSPTVSPLASALSSARSALSSALSPARSSLSSARSAARSVLSAARSAWRSTLSPARSALSRVVSCAPAGSAVQASPSAAAIATVLILCMVTLLTALWCNDGASEGSLSAFQFLLRHALHVRRVHLSLVGLHDVAHEAAHLLDVGDAERLEALADQGAQGALVHALRKEALAEGDLEPELRHLGGATVAELLVLRERLLELLAVGADHLGDHGVVHVTREALGGAALREPRLEHPDDVGRPRVLLADGPGQRLGELLLQRHQLMRLALCFHSRSRSTNFCTLPVDVFGRSPNSMAAGHLKCAM